MPQFDHEAKIVYISAPQDIIEIDQSCLLNIIEEYRQHLSEYKNDSYLWHLNIEDEADEIFNKIRENLEIYYPGYRIVFPRGEFAFGKYDRSLSLSIRYEILERLGNITKDKIRPSELLIFKKFLNTPEGHELEAWKWWEEYWKNRVTPEEE